MSEDMKDLVDVASQDAKLNGLVNQVQPSQRFSQIYCKPSELLQDSREFRVRLSSFLCKNLVRHNLAENIQLGLGKEVRSIWTQVGYWYYIEDYIKECPISVVLDIVSIAFQMLNKEENVIDTTKRKNFHPQCFYAPSHQKEFVDFVNQCFSDENLCYIVDSSGVVHFNPDEEFSIQKASTLKCLEDPRYKAVLCEFNKACSALDSRPVQTKFAYKSIFESLEILCKLIADAKGRDSLGEALINKKLKMCIEKNYQISDVTVKKSISLKITGFANWVEAMHLYRHGQHTTEPHDPPLGLAILDFSHGAAYLRWLVEIDCGLRQSALNL